MADDTNTAEREAAEQWLRDRYGAYRGHFAWRELEEAFLAGRASLAASAGSEPVASSEDVQKKIQSNTWDHFSAILPTLKAISRGDWYWGANSRCKYIEIRLDTRDGGCLLFDRERVRISPEQFAHQSYGGVKMEPWPATDLTHPSPPEGMAMVPTELTPEMKRAAMDLLLDGLDIYVNAYDQVEIQTTAPARLWAAMIAAAIRGTEP